MAALFAVVRWFIPSAARPVAAAAVVSLAVLLAWQLCPTKDHLPWWIPVVCCVGLAFIAAGIAASLPSKDKVTEPKVEATSAPPRTKTFLKSDGNGNILGEDSRSSG